VFGWERFASLLTSAHEAQIFGVPLYATFANAAETPSPGSTRALAVVLIILMSVTSFLTQRQLLLKNTATDNPIAQQMKIMMYIFPVMFALGGLNFPIGVLMYWFTTNLWTMGQQFWVIRNSPQPGTPAAEALAARRARRAMSKGELPSPEDLPELVSQESPRPRTQPKKQPRSKRSGPQRKS
jgi:YidC/Oxa1 family membrane protein insertase